MAIGFKIKFPHQPQLVEKLQTKIEFTVSVLKEFVQIVFSFFEF
jgi:hypothetical protein